MSITIINEMGSATRTSNVEAANAETHIRARDRFASEAEILLAYAADCSCQDPVAWKWNDARFIFDEDEAREIELIDPSLITRIAVKWII